MPSGGSSLPLQGGSGEANPMATLLLGDDGQLRPLAQRTSLAVAAIESLTEDGYSAYVALSASERTVGVLLRERDAQRKLLDSCPSGRLQDLEREVDQLRHYKKNSEAELLRLRAEARDASRAVAAATQTFKDLEYREGIVRERNEILSRLITSEKAKVQELYGHIDGLQAMKRDHLATIARLNEALDSKSGELHHSEEVRGTLVADLAVISADRDLYEKELKNSDDDLVSVLEELKRRTTELSLIVSDLEAAMVTKDQAVNALNALQADLDDFGKLRERFMGHQGYAQFEESMFISCSNAITDGLAKRKPDFDLSVIDEIVASFIASVREEEGTSLPPNSSSPPDFNDAGRDGAVDPDRALLYNDPPMYRRSPVVVLPEDSRQDCDATVRLDDSTPEEHVVID